MKSILNYINITESLIKSDLIDAIKTLSTAAKTAVEEYIKQHKPTDTINDYIKWATDRVKNVIISTNKGSLTDSQLNELVKQFNDSARKEVKKLGFTGKEPFDVYITALKNRKK